jgi:hypothetical protein
LISVLVFWLWMKSLSFLIDNLAVLVFELLEPSCVGGSNLNIWAISVTVNVQ